MSKRLSTNPYPTEGSLELPVMSSIKIGEDSILILQQIIFYFILGSFKAICHIVERERFFEGHI